MAAYDTLRAAIDNYIKANGNKEITGTILNDILNAMVTVLGADTRFAGVATPSTNPGNPEGNVIYFASQAGTYSNFGSIVLPLGIHILLWNGTTWTSQTWFTVDQTPTEASQNFVTSGAVLQAIVNAVGVERLRAIGAEVTSCSFNGTTKKISFFNSANTTLFQLDATAFVIDGMVSDVKIEDGNLVIQFNTDAGKQDIEIPLTDIFNPDNYYTKTQIDNLLTAINSRFSAGYLYKGVATPAINPSTPTEKVFYITTTAGTYTYFLDSNNQPIVVKEGEAILKYDGTSWSLEQYRLTDGGVFDVTAYSGSSFASLDALLSDANLNNIIPASVRKGGMEIRFVQSSDNKYVQYRLMSDTFNTTPANWQGIDDEPTAGSENLVKSSGVAKQFGILDKADVVGNNSSWASYNNSNIIIKAGESVRIVFTGPITFAGTDITNTFLSVYWRTRSSSTAHYISTKLGNVGTIDNFTEDFTATEDCYLCFEGRWHDTETLNIYVYTGLLKQVEDNKAEQDKINRGVLRAINSNSIAFDNTERKVLIGEVLIANPNSSNSRLTIPATEVPYNFNISSTSEWWLVYNVANEEYKFMPAGTTTANDIVIACFSIQGNNPVSTVVVIGWCSIPNCLLNGVYYGLHNVRGTARVVYSTGIAFDNSTRKITINEASFTNTNEGAGRLTIPATEVLYDFNIRSTSEWWLVYNIISQEYKFISAGYDTFADIVFAGFKIQGNNPNSIITELLWCAIQNYSLNGVSIQTQINDNKKAIQDAQQNIADTRSYLKLSSANYSLQNIIVGSIWNVTISASNNRLIANAAIKVIPNTKIHCIHANDISIKITELNSSKGFIKQKGYEKFESLILDSNTHYIIISADYSERGYSDSNPISVSAYNEGDFGVELADSRRIEAVEKSCERLIDDFEDKFYFIDGSTWRNGGYNYNVRVIPVVGGGTIYCKANPNIATRIAFLNSFDEENIIANLPVAIDGTGNQNTNAGQTRTYDIPSSCTHIAINSYYGQPALPDILIINGVNYTDNTKKLLLDNIDKTSDIDSAIGGVENETAENFTIGKGTLWNGNVSASDNCLYGEEYIEVIGGSIIEVFSADYVKTRISEYNSNRVYIKSSGTYNFLKQVKLDQNTKFVRISGEYIDDTYTAENPITVDHFTLGDFGFNYLISGYKFGDIKSLNEGIFRNIVGRNIQKDSAVRATGVKAVNSDIKPLSFIHISDTHTKSDNYKCFESACEFLQHYSNIKCMIATGDLVWDTYHDPTTWYDLALAKTSKPVLNVIGNHDAGQYNATYGLGSQSSDLECYNKFIAPYVNAGTLPNGVTVPGWGVVQPSNAATEGKSYYYKDFADEKVRLIVLNEFETDYEVNQEGTGLVYNRETRAMRQAQVTWLIDTLTNTPSDYGVIVAYHQPDALASEDNEFVSFDLTAEYRATHGAASTIAHVYCADEQWLPKILNAFATKSSLTLTVTQTGAVVTSSPTLVCDCDFTNVQSEFICILNGHTHRDYIGHHFNYSSLTVLCVGADNLRYTSSFQPRLEGTPSEDLFNVVNIDRNRKTIKIIRIGSDASVTGQVRDQMIVSYATT